MVRRTILVTGGAGYIGSHVVRQLGEQGEKVLTLDDLSHGLRNAVLCGELIVGDSGDTQLLNRLIRDHRVDTVMHCAASTTVAESVANPLRYYANNTANTLSLLKACLESGVSQLVFSSTAAVYGNPADGTAGEDTPTDPINAYGSSKLVCEWMLRDLARVSALRYVALRYFNVAGSDPGARIGQSTPGATRLIKVATEHAIGRRPHVSIYGTDYATPDGTAIRDYIHVEDVARAHLAALRYLRDGGRSDVLNCGYGHGYSVREVLDAVARAAGRPLSPREDPRRAGDPPVMIARAERIRRVLGWRPQFDDLDYIVGTAMAWERELLRRDAA